MAKYLGYIILFFFAIILLLIIALGFFILLDKFISSIESHVASYTISLKRMFNRDTLTVRMGDGYIMVDRWKNIHYMNLKKELHRSDDLPAVIKYNGRQEWWLDGQMHRPSGPAVIEPNGYKGFYLKGVHLTKEEFLKKTSKLGKALFDG